MTDEVEEFVLEPEDGEGSTGTPEQRLKALRQKLMKAEAEAAENLAGWQRAKADYINLHKRVREADQAINQTVAVQLLRELTPLFDSIEASNEQALMRQLDTTLQRLGAARHTPEQGAAFDPNREEAVSAVATDKKEDDNTIQSVLQSGYVYHDTVIRPARVAVFHLSST